MILVSLALILAGAIYLFVVMPGQTIGYIEITWVDGRTAALSGTAQSYLESLQGMNYHELDRAGTEQQLESFPLIRNAVLHMRYPDKLFIELEAETVLAVLEHGDTRYFILEEGTLEESYAEAEEGILDEAFLIHIDHLQDTDTEVSKMLERYIQMLRELQTRDVEIFNLITEIKYDTNMYEHMSLLAEDIGVVLECVIIEPISAEVLSRGIRAVLSDAGMRAGSPITMRFFPNHAQVMYDGSVSDGGIDFDNE